MSSPNKTIIGGLPPPTAKPEPPAAAMLVAQWQDGLQMLSGYRLQKLRLSFERPTPEQEQSALVK